MNQSEEAYEVFFFGLFFIVHVIKISGCYSPNVTLQYKKVQIKKINVTFH